MTHNFAARTTLFDAESEPTCLYQLISGWIAQARMFEDGRRQITAVLLPGDICDPRWAFDRRSLQTISALTQVTVQKMPFDWQGDENLFLRRAQDLARASRIQTEWLVNLGRKPALARLAHLFCEIAARLGHDGGPSARFDFPLTQTDLADIGGLTSVHVNRTLQDMRAAGLIAMGHRQLEILDYDRLVEIGGFDKTYLERDAQAGDASLWKNVA